MRPLRISGRRGQPSPWSAWATSACPLSLAASDAGLPVIGLDIDKTVVEGLNAGVSHVDDVDDADAVRMLTTGFHATTDESKLEEAGAITVCVPAPLTEDGGRT
jgi:UDP-N-acetyl-D-glucosamine dehydrogenase